jgi:hypothetical protein
LKVLKRTVYSILGLLSALFIICAALLTWAFYHPERTWKLVEHQLLPADLQVSWTSMNWQLEWVGFLKWNISADTQDLKVQKGRPAFVVPIELAHLNFTVAVLDRVLNLNELNLKFAEGGYFTAEPKRADAPADNPFDTLKTALNQLKNSKYVKQLRLLNVEIGDFEIRGASTFAIALRANNSQRASEFQYSLNVTPKTETWRLGSTGRFEPRLIDSRYPFLTAEMQFLSSRLTVKSELTANYNDRHVQILSHPQIVIENKKKKIRVSSEIDGRIDSRQVKIEFQSNVNGLPAPFLQTRFQGEVTAPVGGEADSKSSISFFVTTPLKLFFIDSKMRPPLEKSCHCSIPEVISAELKGKYWPASRQAKLALELDSLTNRLFSLDFAANADVEFKNGEWNFSPELDSKMIIHSFAGLRNFLNARGVMVPAPLDVLDGAIELNAQGPVIVGDLFTATSVQAAAVLKSKNQRVRLRTTTMFKLSRDFKKLDVGLKAVIDELQLELPPIDPVRGIPKLTRDRRFLRLPKDVESKKFKVVFTFDIETSKSNSIQLLTKLAKPYIPVGLRVYQSQPHGVAGFIATDPFEIHYLRRVAKVDVMRIDLKPVGPQDYPLQGRLYVDQTNYRVLINISGTTRAPRIDLSSDPYLPKADIISVLLYDRTSDQLVTGDLETVGSVEAALADRAIGLFGLWLFATTPIRSFSYNAITKVYSATLLLANGLTLGVGTNWEQTTYVEVRKRLTRRWILTATWRPEEDDESAGNLVLQWEKRF